VVDIRHGSPSFMQWIAIELSAENKKQLFIPKGCLHGMLTLTDDVEFLYKCNKYYAPEHDRSIRWNDPVFGIHWNIESPILSQKDANAPDYKTSDARFVF
jgi:dTDP-4-dehydrorhamnose 3,5-epimerase